MQKHSKFLLMNSTFFPLDFLALFHSITDSIQSLNGNKKEIEDIWAFSETLAPNSPIKELRAELLGYSSAPNKCRSLYSSLCVHAFCFSHWSYLGNNDTELRNESTCLPSYLMSPLRLLWPYHLHFPTMANSICPRPYSLSSLNLSCWHQLTLKQPS